MSGNKIPPKKRIKDLTLGEKIYIPEIVKGLSLTLKTMFKPKFTSNILKKDLIHLVISWKTCSCSGK
jgi:hypothetical protein